MVSRGGGEMSFGLNGSVVTCGERELLVPDELHGRTDEPARNPLEEFQVYSKLKRAKFFADMRRMSSAKRSLQTSLQAAKLRRSSDDRTGRRTSRDAGARARRTSKDGAIKLAQKLREFGAQVEGAGKRRFNRRSVCYNSRSARQLVSAVSAEGVKARVEAKASPLARSH